MKIRCPKCNAKFKVTDSMRGKKVKCAKCASPIDTDTCEISESNKVVAASQTPSFSSGNSSDLEALQSKLDEHDVDLAVLLERVEELDNKFGQLDIASEVENNLLSVNGKLAALEEELHDLHTNRSPSDVGGSVDSHALDAVKQSVLDLESKVDELSEQKNEASQIEPSEEIEELKNRIESLESKISMQSKQTTAPAESGVSTTVDVLKLSVKGLETKIFDFSKQMQKMQDLLSSINSKQTSIEKQLEVNEGKLDQLEGGSHSTLMPNNVTSKPSKTEIVLEETGLDEEIETVKPSQQKVSQEDATIEEIHFDEDENSITSNSSADEIIIDQGDEENSDGGSHEELEVDSSATDEEVVYEEVEEEVDTNEETGYDDVEETVKEEVDEEVVEEEVEEVEEEVIEEEVVEEVEEEVVEEVEEVEEVVEEVEEVEEEVVEEVEEEVVVEEPEAGEATVPMPEQPPVEDDKKKKGRSRRGKDAGDKASPDSGEPKKKGFFARLFGKK